MLFQVHSSSHYTLNGETCGLLAHCLLPCYSPEKHQTFQIWFCAYMNYSICFRLPFASVRGIDRLMERPAAVVTGRVAPNCQFACTLLAHVARSETDFIPPSRNLLPVPLERGSGPSDVFPRCELGQLQKYGSTVLSWVELAQLKSTKICRAAQLTLNFVVF